MDLPAVRKWFDLLRWGVDHDLYTYQQSLMGRSGPRAVVNGRRVLMLSSYDYLGLIGHPMIEQAAIEGVRTHGTGTGGVRLLTGTAAIHQQLEREISVFKGTEAAVTFSSGYAANLAAIAGLFGPSDVVLADSLAHRSLLDACLLARVPVKRFRHNDAAALETELREGPSSGRILIVIEGVYSMEGDIGLLPSFIELKERFGAFLLVDEAHSLGVLGQTGRGADQHFGVPSAAVDIWTGSLSKAIGSTGGFIAGSQQLITYLQHQAATFIFSSALCPAAAGAAKAALQVIATEPERLSALRHNTGLLHDGLRDLGFDVGSGATPIIPVKVGQDVAAYRIARELLERGVLTTAVVHPAVPRGEARLRLCATAAHTDGDIEDALRAFTGL
jgi:8-amino-7-oxononanoate synthase